MYPIIYHPFNNKVISLNKFVSKTPTEFRYVERSVFMKEINNQNLCNFELSSQQNMSVPIWTHIGFQQRNRQDSQNLNKDTFCRLPIVSAQCIIGTKNTLMQEYYKNMMRIIIVRVILKIEKILEL